MLLRHKLAKRHHYCPLQIYINVRSGDPGTACRLGVGQPLMMVRVQAGGGAASYDGTCAGWGWGSLL